jgi:AcrR family transcriptional regulator
MYISLHILVSCFDSSPISEARLPLDCLAKTMRDDLDEALDRRSRILDGARAAIMRFGFERASIADVATGAGVSRTAVYQYFPGKEDVLAAVVEEFNAAILEAAWRRARTASNWWTPRTA